MIYNENTVSKSQQRIAQRFIDSVLEGSQLEQPPNYVIRGLNSNEEIVKLEFQKFEKNEKEIKKIDREIKSLQNYLGNFAKVDFEFKENPKKLICMSDIRNTSNGTIPIYKWAGILDFPIASSFIFGRVAKSEKHGGGNYYFAPIENLKSKITDALEKLEEKVPDLIPSKIIEFIPFMELMGSFKFVIEVRDQLKKKSNVIKTDMTTTNLVDTLNEQTELIKTLKKIAHFGTTEWFNVRFVSEVDVSTLFIPYKEATYFHIHQFVDTPKKEFSAINALLLSLEQLNK
ncbi:MAG: hypothetical protein HWN81_20020 [Candidatus Lokiarchaeota archaeon]|nr:hypothetical protein [Candidatus Lokiarchaeota archaeon]